MITWLSCETITGSRCVLMTCCCFILVSTMCWVTLWHFSTTIPTLLFHHQAPTTTTPSSIDCCNTFNASPPIHILESTTLTHHLLSTFYVTNFSLHNCPQYLHLFWTCVIIILMMIIMSVFMCVVVMGCSLLTCAISWLLVGMLIGFMSLVSVVRLLCTRCGVVGPCVSCQKTGRLCPAC